MENKDIHIKGAVWNPVIDGDITESMLKCLSSAGCIYIVLETKNIKDVTQLMSLLDNTIDIIKIYGMTLLIENSNIKQKDSYIYGPFSEGSRLCTIVSDIRCTYNYDNVGICADIFYYVQISLVYLLHVDLLKRYKIIVSISRIYLEIKGKEK